MEELVRAREEAEKAGDYDAAAAAHQAIQEAVAATAAAAAEEAAAKEAVRMREAEEAMEAAFAEFQAKWEEKMDAFAASAQGALDALAGAHAEAEEAFWEGIKQEEEAKPKVRPSAGVLEKQAMEKQAVKAKMYARAKQLQAQIAVALERDAAAAEHARNVSITRRHERIRARMDKETAALHSRIASKRDEGRRRREKEYEALLARFAASAAYGSETGRPVIVGSSSTAQLLCSGPRPGSSAGRPRPGGGRSKGGGKGGRRGSGRGRGRGGRVTKTLSLRLGPEDERLMGTWNPIVSLSTTNALATTTTTTTTSSSSIVSRKGMGGGRGRGRGGRRGGKKSDRRKGRPVTASSRRGRKP